MTTVEELRQKAKELNIKNYSRMNKEQLKGAINSNLSLIPTNKGAERKFVNWIMAMSITAVVCLITAAGAAAYWYWTIRRETMWERLLGMVGM